MKLASFPIYALLVVMFCAAALCQQFQYTTLQVPGSDSTFAVGVNNNGDIVGFFTSGGVTQGFLYTSGTFQTIACPQMTSTRAEGINDSGVIVGFCGDDGSPQGFIFQNGGYQFVDYPGAVSTDLTGINNEGLISAFVGVAFGQAVQAFVYDSGSFVRLPHGVEALGVSNTPLVSGDTCALRRGTCLGRIHGVIYRTTKKGWSIAQKPKYPGAKMTIPNGINDDGDLAGYWYAPHSFTSLAFAYTKNTNSYVDLNIQNDQVSSMALGINNSDKIVGAYMQSDGTWTGFYGQLSAK